MEYSIHSEPFPAVTLKLRQGEQINCEAGAMAYMTEGLDFKTSGGGMKKMFGRALQNESLMVNRYTAKIDSEITLVTRFMGTIVPVELSSGEAIVAQKGSFLASYGNIKKETFFQKKLSAGFFGGEGFIMQKISGNGIVFIEVDGSSIQKILKPNEKIIMETGCLVFMEDSCSLSIERAGRGFRNAFFGGEGLFNTVVEGPGRVVLQTAPINKIATSLEPFLVSTKE